MKALHNIQIWALLALIANFGMLDHSCGQGAERELGLVATRTQVAVLAPGDTVALDFVVDDCSELTFRIRTTAPSLISSIEGPGGQFIDPGTTGTYGATYTGGVGIGGAPILIDLFSGDAFTEVYQLPTLGPGAYTVKLADAWGQKDQGVVVDLTLDSDVVTSAFSIDGLVTAGSSAAVSVAVFEADVPVTGATVTAKAVDPLGGVQTLTLLDNGLGADAQTGDGLYSTYLAPSGVAGLHSVRAVIAGTSSGGLAFERDAATEVNVSVPTATLTGRGYSDYAVDQNGNFLYDFVAITCALNVQQAGTYAVEMTVESPLGALTSAYGEASLSAGTRQIAANLTAESILRLGETGPFLVREVYLSRIDLTGPVPQDVEYEVGYSTGSYALESLERPPLSLTGTNQDWGADSDGNQEYETLEIEIGVAAIYADNYSYEATLVDSAGTEVGRVFGSVAIPANSWDFPVRLSFPGDKFRAWGVAGPLEVRNFSLEGIFDLFDSVAMETSEYDPSQFENKGGDAIFVMVFNRTGQAASDLHLTFQGGEGHLVCDANTVVAGQNCPTPSVVISPPVAQDTVDIDWGTPCVPVEGVAAMIVRTDNGPLRWLSGWWSGPGGVHIGDVSELDIFIFPIGESPCVGFDTMRIERVCVPLGPIVRGPLFQIPGRPCWWRYDCIPTQICFYRVTQCCTVTREDRIVGEQCFSLTGWATGEVIPAHYELVRVTNATAAYSPSLIQPVGMFPSPNPLPNVEVPWTSDFRVVFSDDGGQTYRPGATLLTTFATLGETLQIQGPTQVYEGGWTELLQLMAARYFEAASTIEPLLAELQLTIEAEDSPNSEALLAHFGSIQIGMTLLAEQMFSGVIYDPEPLEQLETGLRGVEEVLRSLDSPRLNHAADNIASIADGVGVSHEMAVAGMSTVEEQDYFLWGLQNRFEPGLRSVATGLTAHSRVHLDLGDYRWYPSTIRGVEVQFKPDGWDVAKAPESLHVSDRFEIDVRSQGPGQVWIKPPGYLSRVVTLTGEEGEYVSPPTFYAGDVDGDNDVDIADYMLVFNAWGAGPTDCSPSDVNASGNVDMEDLQIVASHYGFIGESFPAPPPPPDSDIEVRHDGG
ncbi:MAG: hypothetical protein KDC38_05165 [Planctomycetes bacterium]|nr:hypothetical protein [Planctomycetota bacterium]